VPVAKSSRVMQDRAVLREDRQAGTLSASTDRPADNLAAFPPASAPAQEQEATIETGGYQALFRIPGRVTVMA